MKASNPLLEKAARFIQSAELLFEDGDIDSAASRLYYAMFFVAEALLENLGLSFASHHAVLSAYGQHFAKTRELAPHYHQALLTAFSQRQLGDYQPNSGLQPEDIALLLADAIDFPAAGRDWLKKHPNVTQNI